MDNFKGNSCSLTIPNLVPIVQKSSQMQIEGQYMRIQLPLAIAHASTVHKFQGATANHPPVIYPTEHGRMCPRGLHYVMTSRVTTHTDLYMTAALREDHFTTPKFKKKKTFNQTRICTFTISIFTLICN